MIGAFAPPGQSAEFYGFFGMVGRTSSFIGPFLFGWLADFLADNLVASGMAVDLAEQTGIRQSVFLIVGFLVIGLGLLYMVNEKEGRWVALGEESQRLEIKTWQNSQNPSKPKSCREGSQFGDL